MLDASFCVFRVFAAVLVFVLLLLVGLIVLCYLIVCLLVFGAWFLWCKLENDSFVNLRNLGFYCSLGLF